MFDYMLIVLEQAHNPTAKHLIGTFQSSVGK